MTSGRPGPTGSVARMTPRQETDLVAAASPCPICTDRAATHLYQVKGFDIVRCRCGLVRTVVPEGFDPSSIYTESYFTGGQDDGYANYAATGDQLRPEFARLVDMLRERTGGGKLIEIGSAYGFFLEEAASHFEAYGVEISDAARSACVDRGLDVARSLTPDLLARGPFDVAVMLDVIEHLDDPRAVLDQVHEAMRPGGVLVITTGDHGSRLARLLGRRWRLMTPPQHLAFFDRASIDDLLTRSGFHVETVEHPWRRVPLSLIAYQAARYVGDRAQQWVQRLDLRGGLPVNLFDAMRVVATRA